MIAKDSSNGSGCREKVLNFLAGWYGISLINAWVIFVSGNIIVKMIPMLFQTTQNVTELEEMVDGIATIFVAYGVALEERSSLMHIFHLYPARFSPRQEFTDHICHSYGLSLLLLGLFMELAVQLVKIPDRVINTQGIEWLMFSIALAFIVASTYMICRLSWFLLRPQLRETGQSLNTSVELAMR
jgi:hypothetical protein